MSDIREKMLKAGLITEAQATQAEAERPRGAGPGGSDGARGGGGKRRGRGRGRRGGGTDGPPASAEASADASQVAEASRVNVNLKGGRGGRRWYYVSREGLVPFVELPEDAADKLGRGDVALVESPEGVTWLVPREAAHRIARLDETWIRAFNQT